MAESQKVRELRAQVAKWQQMYFAVQHKQSALRTALVDLLQDDFEPKHEDE